MKQWQQQIKKESRLLDREMRGIETAQRTTKLSVKQLANKGDIKNAKMLAVEVVRSNKQKDRLATSKARLNSINMQLTHQLCGSLNLYICTVVISHSFAIPFLREMRCAPCFGSET